MAHDEIGDITRLLHEWREGSPDAENELFEQVMPDLRRLAQHLMKGERKGHSLQATELVDQVYLRLVSAKNQDWRNRQHFFAIAASVLTQKSAHNSERRWRGFHRRFWSKRRASAICW